MYNIVKDLRDQHTPVHGLRTLSASLEDRSKSAN